MTARLLFESAGRTDTGMVRKSNQDSFLVDEANGVYIVADGMGGHAGGEIASRLAVESVTSYLSKHQDKLKPEGREHPDPEIYSLLSEAINHASSNIYDCALENPALLGMGTTVTLLKIIGNHGYIGHVGDSRLYLLRCGYIYQMTIDHSLISEQVRAGLLTEEEAKNHHLRTVITRSVGYQQQEYVDTHCFEIEDGDRLILCSDGLHGKMSDAEIATRFSVAESIDLEESAGGYISLANERGGDDNISVVLVAIRKKEP